MARIIYQNRPVADRPNIAVGIALPFNKSAINANVDRTAFKDDTNAQGRQYNQQQGGASVFELNYTTYDQAISNLRNLLGTTKGERFMQPRFGTELRKAIFEPNTSAFQDIIEERLIEDIKFWLPYLIIEKVLISRRVSLVFKIDPNGANLVINVLLNENQTIVSEVSETTTINEELVGVDTFGGSTIVPGVGAGAY
jgi:phage baseplate assembly protein W